MDTCGEMRMDPGALSSNGAGGQIEVVVPYTDPVITAAVLRRVQALTAGLNATVSLVAVHALPYPLPFVCPAMAHAHLVERLLELASECPVPVTPLVVLARYRDEGLRCALKPASTVVIGVRKQLFRSREEKLACELARAGHKVTLIHVT
jgi:hypothetical protein